MNKYLFLFLIIFTKDSFAIERITSQHSCTFIGELSQGSETVAFTAVSEAIEIIDKIVEESGLARNFEVRSGNVPNASALINGNIRYIIYNQNFMQNVRQQTNNKWGAISIMAHEVGHHLNAHTLSGGSRPDKELEADYFSGFVLQKMGAKIEDAQVAMKLIGSDRGSATHPAKDQRLAAIASGWSTSCDKDSDCSVFGSQTKNPPIKQSNPPQKTKTQLNLGQYRDKYIDVKVGTLLIDYDNDKQAEREFSVKNSGGEYIKIKFFIDIYTGSCNTAPINMPFTAKRDIEFIVKPYSTLRNTITLNGFLSRNVCGGFEVGGNQIFYH